MSRGYTRAAARRRVNSRAERKRTSAAVRHNRRKALTMSRGYVLFLSVISIATVLMCVQYLQLKETITAQEESLAEQRSELVSMKSENDALLETINNSIDWNTIRETAIHELGMKYPDEDQIVWYNDEESSSVRQYQDVPANQDH